MLKSGNTERRIAVAITAIVNQKGGASKSTVSHNLAAVMAEAGERVLLIDADPQQNAQDWLAVRDDSAPFRILGLSQPVLHRELPNLADDYDQIIIDGSPRNYEVTRSAIAAADLVMIPVQPSGADFWAARDTVKLVKEAHAFKETQKSVFLLARKIGRSALARDIGEALAEFGLPILRSGTVQRVIYAEPLTPGRTVIELGLHGPAAQEMRAILSELRELMK
jgi:chromosome partitioning protein